MSSISKQFGDAVNKLVALNQYILTESKQIEDDISVSKKYFILTEEQLIILKNEYSNMSKDDNGNLYKLLDKAIYSISTLFFMSGFDRKRDTDDFFLVHRYQFLLLFKNLKNLFDEINHV
jgi:hypothetical protein